MCVWFVVYLLVGSFIFSRGSDYKFRGLLWKNEGCLFIDCCEYYRVCLLSEVNFGVIFVFKF